MMREKDGRSKGCAFIRYFDRRACYLAHSVASPRTKGCSPSRIGLQPLLAPLLLQARGRRRMRHAPRIDGASRRGARARRQVRAPERATHCNPAQ